MNEHLLAETLDRIELKLDQALAGRPATQAEHVHWLDTNGVAARLRVSPSTIRYWRYRQIGPIGFKLGRNVRYDAQLVDRWAAEHQAAITTARTEATA